MTDCACRSPYCNLFLFPSFDHHDYIITVELFFACFAAPGSLFGSIHCFAPCFGSAVPSIAFAGLLGL